MIRQLYYLRKSGIIKLSIRTEFLDRNKTTTETKPKPRTETKTTTETKPKTKPKTKQKTESKKWKEFKERFRWVNELLDKIGR